MEYLIPIFRMIHFVGFSLLLGGTLCSIVLVKRRTLSPDLIKIAYDCIHIVAAPGLLLLLITGIFQSSIMHWANFKHAGYMHAKIGIVLIILFLLIYDLRTQKRLIKGNLSHDMIIKTLRKRQTLALANCILVLLIMWLINYRPF
jgi:uncharacterized membrane protein